MTEAVTRTTLLEQPLGAVIVGAVEVRRITLRPGVEGGPHRHNGPVFGSIETGSAIIRVAGCPAEVLRPGDVFFEPADVLIERFDATAEGVTFLGYFLTRPGERPEITPVPGG